MIIKSLNLYLKDVFHCESQLFTLRELVGRMETKMSVLGQKLPEANPPLEPTSQPVSQKVSKATKTLGRVVGAFFSGVVLSGITSWFNASVNIALIAFFIPLIIVFLNIFKEYQLIKKNSDEEWEKYQKSKQIYNEEQSKRRYMQEENTKALHEYQIQLFYLNSLIKNMEDTLEGLYNENIIHPKYRNYTAISSFIDYLSTGRTSSLMRVGSDPGAYNLYEEDVRTDKIVNAISHGFSRLENRLNEIARNQHSLHQSMLNGQRVLNDLKNEMEKGEHYFNQSTYYLEEISNNSRILVDLQRDRWGDLRNKGGYLVYE
ncbi:MAG: hypothetical protein ACOX6O_03685 [Christensenellales bacterium]|jgi:hypothetical protein